MLAVVSPAKNLDFSSTDLKKFSQPDFLDDTKELVEVARKQSRSDIKRLMKLSDNLAELNFQRYQDFSFPFDLDNAKQAVLAFNGDTYVGLDAGSLNKKDLDFAQKQLRILSGLYGYLKPLDLIQPYRLEMGTKLLNGRGGDLYSFWGKDIAKAVNSDEAKSKNKALINLASNEYSKAIDRKALEVPVITPTFKEIKDGQARVLGMFAKQARGMMARFMILNRIKDPEGLKDFDLGGYRFQPKLSSETDWVFTRKQPPKKS